MSSMWTLTPFSAAELDRAPLRCKPFSDIEVALRKGDIEKIWQMIHSGIPLPGISSENSNLRLVIQNCADLTLIRRLVQSMSKEDLDYLDEVDISALSTAAMEGNTEVIELLVEANADVNLCKRSGQTALHSVIYFVYNKDATGMNVVESAIKTARVLIRLGAFVDGHSETTPTPLEECIQRATLQNIPIPLITYLVSEGADTQKAILPSHSLRGRMVTQAIEEGLSLRERVIKSALPLHISLIQQLILAYL